MREIEEKQTFLMSLISNKINRLNEKIVTLNELEKHVEKISKQLPVGRRLYGNSLRQKAMFIYELIPE